MEKISNTILEKKIFTTRLKLTIIFIIILTIILIVRIYNLQIVNYKSYAKESINNQLRIVPIAPTRGTIMDRNGEILADNKLAYKLTVVQEKTKDINKTILDLKKYNFIDDNDIKKFNKNKNSYTQFNSIPLKHKLSETKTAKFLVSNKFNGVSIESYFYRIYPHNKSSAHIIGYVSKINKQEQLALGKKNYTNTSFVGKTGIEKQYEKLLRGVSGEQQIKKNASARIIDSNIIKRTQNGKDLILTIDLHLQQKAESLMQDKQGSIVAIDVENGEILILVSSPSYNPNYFVNGISTKDYNELINSKLNPQLNRSIQGLYPPGSTIKPIMALIGLEENIIKNNFKNHCPGYFKLKNYSRKFNDWKKDGHGNVNVQEAIAQSCDVFFYNLADKMGIDTMHKNLLKFNFGQKTNIDLPYEKTGILPSKAWKKSNKNKPWYMGETIITGIGQGFITVSPLQLAVITAAIANKGRLFQPKLLKGIKENNIIKATAASQYKQIPIKNIENWENITLAMQQTIESPKGTAKRLKNGLTYSLAGKTGTAQVSSIDNKKKHITTKYNKHLQDHALFIGFAPVEKPKIAIAIIVENAGSGSTQAAPLARIMLDEYFKRYPVN